MSTITTNNSILLSNNSSHQQIYGINSLASNGSIFINSSYPVNSIENNLCKGSIKGTDVLYRTDFTLNVYTTFHFNVWQYIFSEKITDYSFITESTSKANNVLVFGSKKSRLIFNNWWRKYKKMFHLTSYENNFLPSLVAGKVSGYVVPYYLTHENLFTNSATSATPDDKCTEVWSWIVTNCRRPVSRVFGSWIFLSHVDMVAFKLKWSEM